MSDDEFFRAYSEGRVKRREDAWTESNWEEKMEATPLFMKSAPTQKQVDESPELSALQSIINDYEPDEKANYSKQHGNDAFKKGRTAKERKYKIAELRRAVLLYTEGLEANSTNAEMNSTLLSNRAAANMLLENFRQVILDCQQAIKLFPANTKAYFRAASANMKLEKYDEVTRFCDAGLLIDPTLADLTDLRRQAGEAKAAAEKKKRLEARAALKVQQARQRVGDAIKARGIKVCLGDGRPADPSSPEFEFLRHPSQTHDVQLDDKGNLVWPVLFVYPEHQQTELMVAFDENATFADALQSMFPDTGDNGCGWDTDHKYRASNMTIFFYHDKTCSNQLIEIPLSTTLAEALCHPQYRVLGGLPSFCGAVKDSPYLRDLQRKGASAMPRPDLSAKE